MKRSYTPELLDSDTIPFEDIIVNMKELDTINTLLGGHRITLKGLQQFTERLKSSSSIPVVCEIGCGGGDNLIAIRKWCARNGIKVKLVGIDIKEACIVLCKERFAGFEEGSFEFIAADYREVHFTQKPDLIFSSLFCHHFTEQDLVKMLDWKKDQARWGFFINDLHRHPLAYHSIKLLTRAFSKSYLVKNDAPLSVQRGFVKSDWEALLTLAEMKAGISWEWAFRWLIVYKTA